jgi:hypothetical protein
MASSGGGGSGQKPALGVRFDAQREQQMRARL